MIASRNYSVYNGFYYQLNSHQNDIAAHSRQNHNGIFLITHYSIPQVQSHMWLWIQILLQKLWLLKYSRDKMVQLNCEEWLRIRDDLTQLDSVLEIYGFSNASQIGNAIHHGKTTFLKLGLILYSHQEGRQHSTHTPYQGWSSERQRLLTRYVWTIYNCQVLTFIYGQIRR